MKIELVKKVIIDGVEFSEGDSVVIGYHIGEDFEGNIEIRGNNIFVKNFETNEDVCISGSNNNFYGIYRNR